MTQRENIQPERRPEPRSPEAEVTQGAPSSPRRRRFQPKAIGALTVIWLVLVGEVSFVTVVGGAIIAWLVTIVFPLPPVHYSGRLHLWGGLRLLLRLVQDLAVSSVKLAAYAFSRQVPHPGIVRVDLRSDVDLYQVNTAELASVVPGTIVVDARARRRQLYLHVFDLPDPSERGTVVRDTLALESRVVHAFGSRAEIEALDHPVDRGEPRFREVR